MLDENVIRGRFVDELNTRMKNLGVTPGDVALRCRTRKGSVISYMRGDSLPNVWTLALIAEYLDCTVNDLLGFEGIEDVNALEDDIAFDTYPSEGSFSFHVRDRLSQRMSVKHMNNETLSELTGFTVNTIERWTWLYPRLPQAMNLIRLADALDCTPSDLLGY